MVERLSLLPEQRGGLADIRNDILDALLQFASDESDEDEPEEEA